MKTEIEISFYFSLKVLYLSIANGMEMVYADDVQVWTKFFEPNELGQLNALVRDLQRPFPNPNAVLARDWDPHLVAAVEFITQIPNV